MAVTADALAVAKVAVYPMDPAGLQTQSMFQASARMRGNPVTGQHSIGRQIQREDQSRFNRQASMETLAEQTGGIVCINNNDLGDCVRKAVNDGSSFYEIAYYPDSSDWHGEFHKIIVKGTKSGIRLAYRQGYYARPEVATDPKAELQEAACQDLLTSTSVPIVARAYSTDKPGTMKYVMGIDPATLTFPSQSAAHESWRLKSARARSISSANQCSSCRIRLTPNLPKNNSRRSRHSMRFRMQWFSLRAQELPRFDCW